MTDQVPTEQKAPISPPTSTQAPSGSEKPKEAVQPKEVGQAKEVGQTKEEDVSASVQLKRNIQLAKQFLEKARKFGEWVKLVSNLGTGLFSKDAATRRMALLFFFSLVGAIFVITERTKAFLDYHRIHYGFNKDAEKNHLSDFLKRQAEEARHKAAQMRLGVFTIELKPILDGQRLAGIHNLAEIDVEIECDSKETRELMEEHLIEAKSQISRLFTIMDREDLMSKEGKNRIKRMIQDKLNAWLPQGQVDSVFITKLLVI